MDRGPYLVLYPERHRNSRRFELLAQVSDVIFPATLVLAALHAPGVGHRLAFDLSPFLAGLTTVLPAIAAAVDVIRVKREYLRNAERYAHMVWPLSIIRNRIVQTQDPETLMQLLQEAHLGHVPGTSGLAGGLQCPRTGDPLNLFFSDG